MPIASRRAIRVGAVVLAVAAPVSATAAPRATRCADAAGAAPPVGLAGCPDVRPGAPFSVGTESCTMAFVYQGSDRRRYVATAGHCAFKPDPAMPPGHTSVWRADTGPEATDPAGRRLGRFAYATLGSFRDFGLVRLDRTTTANPQVCHFGGPTATRTDVSNDDVQVTFYGHGAGEVVPARTGDAFFGLYKADYFYFYGAAASGDSGAPVLDADGKALGILTDLTTPFTGNVGVNRLAHHIAAAERALKIKLTLLTAPPL